MIVRGLTNSMSAPIKIKDGRTLMSNEEQSNRGMEHSQEVLNQPAASNLIAFEQETPITLLDVKMDNISKEKVAQSISALVNNKADCLNEVTAELIKPGGETIAEEQNRTEQNRTLYLDRQVTVQIHK